MEQEELKRRVGAALRYAGLTQEQLGELFDADGLGVEDPGRIQRGAKQMQHVHAEAFARHTGLPVEWFTADDLSTVIGGPSVSAQLEEKVDAVADLFREVSDRGLSAQAQQLAQLSEVRSVQAEILELLARLARGQGATGNG